MKLRGHFLRDYFEIAMSARLEAVDYRGGIEQEYRDTRCSYLG